MEKKDRLCIPEVIELMLREKENLEYKPILTHLERQLSDLRMPYHELVEFCLIPKNLPEDAQRNIVRAELKKFCSKVQNVPESEARLTPNHVWAYCTKNKLDNYISTIIMKRLGYHDVLNIKNKLTF